MIDFLRLCWKLFITRISLIHLESFCKVCGRTVHDFDAPDHIWGQVDPHIKYGHVLCYDCFCEICSKIGLPAVWKLEQI